MWSIDTGVTMLASGALDHIGGVEPPAEADFQQQHVGRMAREQHEGRRGLDLEQRDRRIAVRALAFGQRIGKLGVGHQHAARRARRGESAR